MSAKRFRITILPILLVLLVLSTSSWAQQAAAQEAEPDFYTLTNDLQAMSPLFSVTEKGVLVFDAEKASDQGFSRESIDLASQFAAATNEVVRKGVAAAKAAGIENPKQINVLAVKINYAKNYPALAAYRKAAIDRVDQETSDDDGSLMVPLTASAYSTCGWFTTPVPEKAASWNTFGPYNSSSTPATTLKNWGYFNAWWVVGGDWTRNQTYQKSICKANTFRDHAYIWHPNSSQWYIKEQNYTGAIPGEPNPVMSPFPWNWPYPLWQQYVLWWHLAH